MIKKWPTVHNELLGDYRVFQLRKVASRSPLTGRTHPFFVLDTADWVNVIPITVQGEVILIRQYRHGTQEVTLEIPGGMVHEGDDSAMASGARELREETGYAADTLIHIGTVAPNPAILNNHCHTYLALGCMPVGPPQLEGTEDIALELAPLADIPALITSGQISHALVIAAFYFYEQFRRQAG